MDGFLAWLKQLQFENLLDPALVVVAAVLSITVHETCHGLVAWWLGDPTAKNAGRLTLNPLKHIDIVGLIMMVAFKFGWAKPVPVDMRHFKHPKRDMAITALAGPVSNVLICCVVLFIYGIIFLPCTLSGSKFWGDVLDMVYLTAYLSMALAVFNIIPVPPLDGSKVLFSLMSDEAYLKLMRYERYGMLLLLVLIATDVLADPLQTVTGAAFKFLFAFAEWGYDLSSILFY